MTSAMAGTLSEAYERLHATGPEFDGYLSNHGPMAAEAMIRHGHGDQVGAWLAIRKRLRFAGVTIMTPADGVVTDLTDGIRAVIDSQYLEDLKHATRRGMAG